MRITIMVEVNCSHRIHQGLLVPLSSSSLGPSSSRRRAASLSPSPVPASVPRASSTSATSEVCQAPPSARRLLPIRRSPLRVPSPASLASNWAGTERDLEGRLPVRGCPLFACCLLRHLPLPHVRIDQDRS